ncbi:MAG: tetratricopeptide repeat protein, partial [Thermodesulfobacteriota bacterium]
YTYYDVGLRVLVNFRYGEIMEKVYVFAALCFLCLAGISATAQIPGASNSRFQDLSIDVSSLRNEYLPLEPIPLVFKISNRTPNGILGHGSLDFSSGYIKLIVKNSRGEEHALDRLSSEFALNVIQKKVIPPGGQFQKTQVLSYDLNRHFPSIGNYGIKAVFSNGDGEVIESSWTDIRIVHPTDLSDKALDFLRRCKGGSFLHNITSEDDAGLHETFVNEFPNTRYAEYALFLLAEHYYYKSEYGRSREFFRRLETHSGFVFAEKVTTYLKELAKRL